MIFQVSLQLALYCRFPALFWPFTKQLIISLCLTTHIVNRSEIALKSPVRAENLHFEAAKAENYLQKNLTNRSGVALLSLSDFSVTFLSLLGLCP